MDIGQHIEYDGLRRASRIAAAIAGASGAEVEEIADEVMARLLMQDGPVNNPKAWVRSTATRLCVLTDGRQGLRPDEVLAELTPGERDLVVGQRVGYTLRELAQRLGVAEETVGALLAEANRKVRRSSRRLTDAGH